MPKVLLAYSGGLDTSVAVRWLKVEKGCDVVAFCANLGEAPDAAELRRRALATGAEKLVIEDLRDRFVTEFIWPALKANAIYENGYPLNTALGRPLIAAEMVRVALENKCLYVAHGCTGKGNDQVRFESTVAALAPQLKVIAPLREWSFKTREEEMEYAHQHKIAIPVTKKKPYSIDANLWGVSVECGELEDPWTAPPAGTHLMTRPPEKAPNKPTEVEITFEQGIPVKLNGKAMGGRALIELLNKIAGENAVGRVDMIENRVVGIKSREVYEAPAAVVLLAAHKALEEMTLSRDVYRQKAALSPVYSELIYSGRWFTDLRDALDGFVAATQKYVSGVVRVRLYKGQCMVVGRKSPHSLYDKHLATYSAGDTFEHGAAQGFLNIYNLDIRAQGVRRNRFEAGRKK